MAAAGIVLACGLTALTLLRPHESEGAALPHLLLDLLTIIALAAIGAGLLLVYVRQIWTRPLRRLIDAARNPEEGWEPPLGRLAGGSELDTLAHVIGRNHRRHVLQLRSLQQQRQTVSALLNQLHEGVLVVDARGRIELLNPAAIRLLQLTSQPESGALDSLLGKPLEQYIPQHDVQRILHSGRRAVSPQTETVRDPAATQEVHLSVESPERTLQVVARASDLILNDPLERHVRHRFVVLTDITELSDALKMKADFVANASHELRTPLSTIRAAVETLLHLDAGADPADARRFLELIDRHSSRLADLVSDLLDLARVESPDVTHPYRTIEVPTLLAELRDRFADRCVEKAIEFRVECEGPSTNLFSSPYLLQLALDNVVDNAIKFSPSGKEVFVLAVFEQEHVRFEVTDQGCGIPEADRRRVFERFYQVERARAASERRGTGLGLAIVKHVMNVLEGTVSIASRTGAGTRVVLVVPNPVARMSEPTAFL